MYAIHRRHYLVIELLINDYLKRHDPGREVKNRAKKAEAVKGTEKGPKISTDNKTSRDVVNRSRTIPAAVRREVWKRDGGLTREYFDDKGVVLD